MKKEGGSFDVTIGAYDMVYLKGKNYNSKNISLYRDDGQALFKNISGSASEKKITIFT